MADLDRGGKLVLLHRPVDLLRLTHPGVRGVRPVGAEAVSAQTLADGVFLAREGGRQVLHQVELVAEPTSRAGRQVVRRTCTLYAAHGKPVRVSVLYLHPSKDRRRGPSGFDLPLGSAPARVAFRVVRVWEDHSAADELARARPRLGLLPLVGLMAETSLEAVAQAAALIREQAASHDERTDLQAALRLLSERRFTDRRLSAIIPEEVLMESRWLRKAQEARDRQILLTLLEERFGRLPREVRERVEAGTPKQVQAWLLRVVSVSSLEEVFKRSRRRAAR